MNNDYPHPIIAREGWPFLALAFVVAAALSWAGLRVLAALAGLVVLFGAIALSSVLGLEGRGVEVVGTLPQGLPSLSLPAVPLVDYLAMVLPAIGEVLVVLSEALGVAHEFAE